MGKGVWEWDDCQGRDMSGDETDGRALVDEAADWLLLLEESCWDPAVRERLDVWLRLSDQHAAAFRSVEKAWRVSEGLSSDYDARTSTADHVVGATLVSARTQRRLSVGERSTRTGRPEAGRGRRPASRSRLPARRIAAIAAMAAAVLLLIVQGPELLLRLQADQQTGTGERLDLTLEDGSHLHLDADSAVAIEYRSDARRISMLAGRAFFEVSSDGSRPFIVATDALQVTVTGTRFEVSVGGPADAVAVQSGAVSVHHGAAAPLGGGDRLTRDRDTGQIERSRIDPVHVGAWRRGRMLADGMPLGSLVAVLRRYHSGLIVVADDELAARRVSGAFDLDRPTEGLQLAAAAVDARYREVTPALIVLSYW